MDKQMYDKLCEEDKRKLEENGIKAKDVEGGSENENNGHRGSTDRTAGITREHSGRGTGIHKHVRGTVQDTKTSGQEMGTEVRMRPEGQGQRVHNESTQTGESKTGERIDNEITK